MQFFQESNGRTLTITVDAESLLGAIDALRTDEDYMEYAVSRVDSYYDADNEMSQEDIMRDLDEFVERINYYAENGDELFEKMAYKKNGTFNRTNKPWLKRAANGAYWEDHYGWNTKVLRLEARTDTEAEVVLTDVIVHY